MTISIGSDHRSIVATIALTLPSKKHCNRNTHARVGKGWKPRDENDFQRMVAEDLRESKAAEADSWFAKTAEQKCRVIEAILNDTAKTQAAIKESAQCPDDKVALRSLIEERKQARRAGVKTDEKTLGKMIQKELKAMPEKRPR